ncbi:MAG: CpsD/CapB family tyrosine-protein kinase [Phycisphaerae bacterium]|nr:CpsD/CapB family tyrosine-protein kinase [Phycisphaerae bacterium]
MGRIAKALKKAQQERSEKLRLGLGEASTLRERDASVASAVVDRHQAVQEGTRRDGTRDRVTSGKGIETDRRTDPLPRGWSSSKARIGFRGPPSPHAASPMGPLPPWDVDQTVVAIRDRNSSITEQYRAVRTWLLSRSNTAEHSCIAVTSSVAREGKSVTVANLAAVMAEVRHLNVLAVDADFRKGSLSRLLRLPNTPGLADAVAGRATLDECIAKTPLGNLFVLPAGASHGLNPAELINSTAAGRVFEEIRERYHFVLVDTPPVQRLSDTGVIGALCTGIVMVVRMNQTPANLVRQSVNWLQSNNLNVMGCIAACCSLNAARSVYREPDKDG